jgi:RNA recognition motif-containing protein
MSTSKQPPFGQPPMNKLVSLYICDIPQDIEKEDLEKLFKDFGGFKDIRVARDKTK